MNREQRTHDIVTSSAIMSSAANNTVINIRVLLFASAREAADNVGEVNLEFLNYQLTNDGSASSSSPVTTTTVRQELANKFPRLADMVLKDTTSMTLAVNEEYVPPGQVLTLKSGDTVALIPPISGG
jgi:molybdopterin converting factor small subunit